MNNFAALKSEVFAKQKVLAKIYAQAGTRSLFDYVRGWAVSSPSENTRVFFNQAQKLLLRVYPAELVDDVLRQNGQSPLVSTIDHHGILNHPFFINSNLIYSQRATIKYLLCLSTAGVSLNNSSWPGCLLFSRPDGRMERFSFFRDKIKTQTVLAVKGFNSEDVALFESHIKAAGFLSKDNKQRLLGLTQEIFSDPGLFEFSDFSEQAAHASSALWQKVFPSAPKLLYLPLEELVNELIVNEILPRNGHILHKLFFTTAGWDSIEKYFHGSLGAFTDSHKGSFLFWGISANLKRVHLHRFGSKIVDHGLYEFGLPDNSLIEALSKNVLYPTSLVCFLVLLYYGITCLGGFNQVNWLTDIKEKFIDLLAEWGERELAARVLAVPTENFAEGSLAFGVNQQGQIYKPSVLDLFLKNDPEIYEKYRQLASLVTVGESIDAQLPEIYRVITPAKDRDSNLLGITENDILNSSSLADKIKSVLGD